MISFKVNASKFVVIMAIVTCNAGVTSAAYVKPLVEVMQSPEVSPQAGMPTRSVVLDAVEELGPEVHNLAAFGVLNETMGYGNDTSSNTTMTSTGNTTGTDEETTKYIVGDTVSPAASPMIFIIMILAILFFCCGQKRRRFELVEIV